MIKINITIFLYFLAVISCENTNRSTTLTIPKETNNTVENTVPNRLEIEFPDISNTNSLSELKEEVNKVAKQIDTSKLARKQTSISSPNATLSIWYDNKIPLKIECGFTNDFGEIIDVVKYYLKDSQAWYVDATFDNYIFQKGKLKYWLNEEWRDNNISKTDFNNRGEDLKSKVKNFIEKLEGEAMFFDEQKSKWTLNGEICHTCTFENGFNPNGWMLSDAEQNLALDVLKAEKMYGVDLKQNRIFSKELLENLIGEFVAKTGEQIHKYENIDISEINKKLALQKNNLTAKQVMKLYYPYTIDENTEGNQSIYISNPVTKKESTFVTLIHDNLLDDSVKAEKYQMELMKKDNKWKVISLKKSWSCCRVFGVKNWGIQLCK